jgi:thiol-disulfide isomerase/thioredoxin
MYRLISFLSFISALSSFGQQVHFTVFGKFPDTISSSKIFINQDSVELSADKGFRYEGLIEKPSLVRFHTDNSYDNYVWVSGGQIELNLILYAGTNSASRRNIAITSIKGSSETEDFQGFEALNSKFRAQHPNRNYLSVDSVAMQLYPFVKDYVGKHPKSFLAPYLTLQSPFTVVQKEELYVLMNNNPDTTSMKFLRTQIERAKLTGQGVTVYDFEQPTSTGRKFHLHALKKRFILVEFWSSDCAPCRWEHPKLVQVYNQFYRKGFEIVSLSIDRQRKNWLQAVQKDQLPWLQVSDLTGWKNQVAQRFKVDYVPFNILMDGSFKILATGLWPSQVEEVLNTLYSGNDEF